MLPITSDTIRSRLFGRKAKNLKNLLLANQELADTINGMLLSDQHIDARTYDKLAKSISNKYRISVSMLKSKDDIISSLLQVINTSNCFPKDVQKLLSERLITEFSKSKENDFISDNTHYMLKDESPAISDLVRGIDIKELIQLQDNAEEYNSFEPEINLRIRRRISILSILLSLIVGLTVTTLTFLTKSLVVLQGAVFLCLFLICISVFLSLMDNTIIKDTKFLRRLVFKIILIMILSVVGMMLTVLIESV